MMSDRMRLSLPYMAYAWRAEKPGGRYQGEHEIRTNGVPAADMYITIVLISLHLQAIVQLYPTSSKCEPIQKCALQLRCFMSLYATHTERRSTHMVRFFKGISVP